ncbi:MAG TPA: response regulator [Terriglobia bacterium]|nr:response regulator [Terriglobia bacterium]
MTKNPFALLVSREGASLEPLKSALKKQSIETWSVDTCEEVTKLVEQTHPELIFTDPRLADGTWLDIVTLIEKASTPVNLIVVGAPENAKLHASAMENGAFDFIQPPFEATSLGQILQNAVENVRHRRVAQALTAVA